jgi:triphosphatase
MATEVELKLDIAADDAAVLPSVLPGAPRTIEQHAIQFDTPDHALAAHGLSLRVRRADGRHIQTVKAGDAGAGLFSRQEWEQAVPGPTPMLGEASPVRQLLGADCDRLGAIFTIVNHRRQWLVQEGDAQIEVALDASCIRAADRECHHAEVELELRQGDPAALFALARRLDAAVPVRLAVLSKAQRGYRLLGPASAAVRAEPLQLPADATAEMALVAIVQSCLRHYRLNEALLLAQPATVPAWDALHQARVALRRLRSALSIFKPLLASDPPPLAELRWLTGVLGDVRDLDVLMASLPAGPLHHSVQAARQAALARAMVALQSVRARHLLLDLAQWLAQGHWRQDAASAGTRTMLAAPYAAGALKRLRGKVRKRGSALNEGNDEVRHELRKTAKKLRYATEFLGSLFPAPEQRKRHQRFVAALAALQDELGALNDLVTGRQLLAAMGIAHASAARALLAGDRTQRHLASASAAHHALLQAKRFWR